MIATREGAHAGDGICALVNDIDIFFNLSKLGVFNPGIPPSSIGLIQSLRSSIAMKMILGFLAFNLPGLFQANPLLMDKINTIERQKIVFKVIR